MADHQLRALAPDLTRNAPRSPRVPLGEFLVVATRLLDKCRAELLGQNGSYRFNCAMDRKFLAAAGLDAMALKQYIATGAGDAAVAAWMSKNASTSPEKIGVWSRRFRANTLCRVLELEDWLHVRVQRKK